MSSEEEQSHNETMNCDRGYRYRVNDEGEWWMIGEFVLDNDVYTDKNEGVAEVRVYRREGDEVGKGRVMISFYTQDWPPTIPEDSVFFNEESKQFELLP